MGGPRAMAPIIVQTTTTSNPMQMAAEKSHAKRRPYFYLFFV